ncbi:MAG: methyl-accepting chemotaxis protein [Brevinema sp.]
MLFSRNKNTPTEAQVEGKKIFRRIYRRLLVFTLFVSLPIAAFQELFLIKSCGRMEKFYPSFFTEIHIYADFHNVLGAYAILTVLVSVGLWFFVRPIKHYLMTGVDAGDKAKKIIVNPYIVIPCFIAISLLANTINFILDFKHFMAIPTQLKVLSFINRILWQVNASLLFTFFFRALIEPIKVQMGLYTFDKKEFNWIAQFRDVVLIGACALSMAIFMFELARLSGESSSIENQSAYLESLRYWSWLNISGVCFSVLLMLWMSASRKRYGAEKITNTSAGLVDTGDLSVQLVFDDANDSALLTSALNSFIYSLKQNVMLVKQSALDLNRTEKDLSENTQHFIQAVNSQEHAVARMSFSAQNTGQNVQQLGEEVNNRYQTLSMELSSIDELISGTEQMMLIFNQIAEEYEVSSRLSQEGATAVAASMEKSIDVNDRLQEIALKIRQAGQETEGIDEVLSVIQNISEQTDLLSMNAAIEAAHGGKSEKGFAQVAGEVRTLANMSKEAVDRIASRLSSITGLIHESVDISVKSLSLSEQTAWTGRQLKESIGRVSESTIELTENARQALPIAERQEVAIKEFQAVSEEAVRFLQELRESLRQISGTSVTMSLNFEALSQNFHTMHDALFAMLLSLDEFSTMEKRIGTVTKEFNLGENAEFVPSLGKDTLPVAPEEEGIHAFISDDIEGEAI